MTRLPSHFRGGALPPTTTTALIGQAITAACEDQKRSDVLNKWWDLDHAERGPWWDLLDTLPPYHSLRGRVGRAERRLL